MKYQIHHKIQRHKIQQIKKNRRNYMKKLGFRIIGLLMITVFLLQGSVLLAVSQKDLKETDKKIDEAEKELTNIQNEKSETMKQVEAITTEISSYQTQIDEDRKSVV